MSDADSIDLPAWSQANAPRRAHIARVVALLDRWAAAFRLTARDTRAWHDAGRWHDALRDAPAEELRAIVPEMGEPASMLHGPAAAAMLARDGEARGDVLDAIRWHTVGRPAWSKVGQALYMADFLEPGRSFARAERGLLASQVPHDFAGVFRQVVQLRVERANRAGRALHPQTEALWKTLR